MLLLTCLGGLPFFSAQVLAQRPPEFKPIQVHAEEIVWKEGNANLPRGTMIAVLEGNPKAEGIFTMRVKLPPGGLLIPHTHPREERVTILEGRVFVGFGEVVDWSSGTRFNPGDYYVNPSGAPHFVWSNEGAIVQITGMGPWEIHFLAGE